MPEFQQIGDLVVNLSAVKSLAIIDGDKIRIEYTTSAEADIIPSRFPEIEISEFLQRANADYGVPGPHRCSCPKCTADKARKANVS